MAGRYYLLLWLEAPLQSWGYDSRFGRRSTLEFPTRSGVLGLICCARGAGGPENNWLNAWMDLDMQVVAYAPSGRNQMVRQPLLRDFHMVGSGYDEGDPWQKLLIPKKSDGGKSVGGGAKLTYRYYVQDMTYAVLLQVPDGMEDELCAAIKEPVWDLYLGRKCCVPTEFIFQGLFDDAALALTAASDLADDKKLMPVFKVLQGEHEGSSVFTLNDVPVQFGQHKIYRDRRVTVQSLEE